MRAGFPQVIVISGQAAKFASTLRQIRFLSTAVRINSAQSSAAIKSQSKKWDLYVGLCLERRPVITKDLTPLEKRYAEFMTQYEFELSKKSDHEIRHLEDEKLLEKIKRGEVEQGNVQTAQDFEDLCTKEFQAFQPASRETDADKKNDLKSLDRALQSHLLLAVKQTLGNDYKWTVPHMKVTGEESLKQVAHDALTLFCPDVRARVLGNAPWGVYKYNYPKAIRDVKVADGCKIFFYKAQLLSGQMNSPKDKTVSSIVKDYAWLTRAELPEHFAKDYFNSISELLIPEY